MAEVPASTKPASAGVVGKFGVCPPGRAKAAAPFAASAKNSPQAVTRTGSLSLFRSSSRSGSGATRSFLRFRTGNGPWGGWSLRSPAIARRKRGLRATTSPRIGICCSFRFQDLVRVLDARPRARKRRIATGTPSDLSSAHEGLYAHQRWTCLTTVSRIGVLSRATMF